VKEWDLKLRHAEFTYNRTPARAIGCSPFEALYGINPLTLTDLIPLPTECKVIYKAKWRAKEIKKLHEQIRAHIEKINKTYKIKTYTNRKEIEYQPSDLIWLHLRKERFPTRRKSKLMARGEGPFKVLGKVGTNAYKPELYRDMAVSTTFNTRDLSPYVEDDIGYGI